MILGVSIRLLIEHWQYANCEFVMLNVIIVGVTSIVSVILLTAMCCKRDGKAKTEKEKTENLGNFVVGSVVNYLIKELIILYVSKLYSIIFFNLESKLESGNDYDEISIKDSENEEMNEQNDITVDTTAPILNEQSEHINPSISNIYYGVEPEVNNQNIRDQPIVMESITSTRNPYYSM